MASFPDPLVANAVRMDWSFEKDPISPGATHLDSGAGDADTLCKLRSGRSDRRRCCLRDPWFLFQPFAVFKTVLGRPIRVVRSLRRRPARFADGFSAAPRSTGHERNKPRALRAIQAQAAWISDAKSRGSWLV